MLVLCAPVCAEPPADAAPQTVERRIHATLGVDYTNSYFFRGIVQDADGVIFQPYAGVEVDAYTSDTFRLSISAISWNSIQDAPTGTGPRGDSIRSWYESDLTLGTTARFGDWAVGVQYVWYTSPSNAFRTTDEIDVVVAYDDSKALGKWSLKPAVTLAWEVGDGRADRFGSDRGTFAQVGIAPGFPVRLSDSLEMQITFPASVGISLGGYYEDPNGSDDTLGFLSLGVKATLPLTVPAAYGAWVASIGAAALFLGDHTADYNGGDDNEVVVTFGIAGSF